MQLVDGEMWQTVADCSLMNEEIDADERIVSDDRALRIVSI